MEGFDPLMQQKKFSEAEALVDRALKLLQPNAPASAATRDTKELPVGSGGREASYVPRGKRSDTSFLRVTGF